MPEYSKDQVLTWLQNMSNGMLNLNYDNTGFADAAIAIVNEFEDDEVPLKAGYLSPHFTLAEMTRSDTATARGIDNTPNEQETVNLSKVCETMEEIRSLLGDKPITITSAFRSEALNKAVGGVPNSAHRLGLAADFVCPSFGTPTQICNHLLGRVSSLDLDQLINEKTGGGEWVHIGLSLGEPRYQALTITDSGTQIGIV